MGNKEKEIKVNEAARDSALRRGNKEIATGRIIEIGTLYRHDRDEERAMEQFEEALKLAREARYTRGAMQALRAIAEMKAEKGDKQCIELLGEYEELAKNDNTEYQLMLSVACYCRLRLYAADDYSDDSMVKEALECVRKSLKVLGENTMEEKKMTPEIDTVLTRTIDCHRMLAEVAGYQEDEFDGKIHYEIALRMVSTPKARYEVIRTAYDFPWSEKLKIAKQMCAITERVKFGKNVEAHIFLAQAYFERGDVNNAVKSLFNVAAEAANPRVTAVSFEDKTRNSELLVFAFKVEKAQKELQECKEKEDRAGQYRVHEKLGDFYNNAGFKNGALLHYEKMLELAEQNEEKLAALSSCAETAKDLKKFKRAADYFEDVQEVEEELKKDVSYTLVNQFLMKLNAGNFLDDEDVQMQINSLKDNKFLYVAYSGVATYYEKKGMKAEADKFKKLEEQIPSAEASESEEQEEENETDDPEYAKMLYEMRERAKAAAEKKKLLKAARKKTYFGETKLMEMVRKGQMENVKILVEEEGVNVSEGDGNGWTPLSEAVGSNDVEMVNYLLMRGANPTTCSKPNTRSWCGLDFGGKITPLMEACLDGRCEIANVLLDHTKETVVKAMVIATNEDGWSARDFLVDFINKSERDDDNDEDIDACEELAKRIKDLQTKFRFPERGAPPKPKPKSDDTTKWQNRKARDIKRAAERRELKKRGQLNPYSSVMVGLRNRRNARRMMESDGETNDTPDIVDSDDEGTKKKKRKRNALNRVAPPNDSDDDDDDDDDRGDEESTKRRERATRRKRRRSSVENEDGSGNDKSAESDEDMPRRTRRKRKCRRVASDDEEDDEDESEEESENESEEDEESNKSGSESGDDEPDEDDDEESAESPGRPKDDSTKENENDGGNNDAGDSQSSVDEGPIRGRNNQNRSRIESDDEENEHESKEDDGVEESMDEEQENEKEGEEEDEEEEEEVDEEEDREERDMRREMRNERRQRMYKVRNPVPADDATGISIVHDDEVDGDESEEALSDQEEDRNGSVETSGNEGDQSDNEKGSAGSSSSEPVAPKRRKTQNNESEKSPDASDSPAVVYHNAIAQLKAAEFPSLDLRGGSSMFTETTLAELWKVIEDYMNEKKRVDPDWRVESVRIANIDVPTSTLLAIIRMRPRDELALRYCEIDNEKLEEIVEELEVWSEGLDSQLNSLDLSFNPLSGSRNLLARLVTSFRGLNTVNLQGLSGIEEEDGIKLMKALRGLPLRSLILNENPWVDDARMTELLRGREDGQARLSTLKILQISKCAIRSMDWLDTAHGLASLKSLNLADNCGIAESGWKRVVGFIQSTATTLTSLDVRGTSVRAVMLEPLATRSLTTPLLTVMVSRCNGITPVEICRVIGPLVGNAQPLKMKLQLEEKKIEEVMRTAPAVAEKALKVASEAFT